jgi:hypothetical protein
LQICPPLPSVLASVLAVLGEQQKKERGERKPTDIVVETILAPGDESWAAQAAKSSSKSRNTSKEGTPGPLSMDDRINIISGNPFVEVTKGVIHLYKLSEPVPDTKMMAMLGVPAKHKTPDLLQLTAPCHQDLEYRGSQLLIVECDGCWPLCSAVQCCPQCSVGCSAVQCWLQCSAVLGAGVFGAGGVEGGPLPRVAVHGPAGRALQCRDEQESSGKNWPLFSPNRIYCDLPTKIGHFSAPLEIKRNLPAKKKWHGAQPLLGVP